MKCYQIRTRPQGGAPFFPNMLDNGKVEVCLKEDVDAVIAELKCEIVDARDDARSSRELIDEKNNEIVELKAENMGLKAKNAELQSFYDLHGNVDNYIDKLKTENERLLKENSCKFYKDCLRVRNYEQELRATRRALWRARAESAEARKNYWYARSCHEGDKDLWSIDGSAVKYIGCIKRTNFDWLKVWSEVEIKCLKKAEEYK